MDDREIDYVRKSIQIASYRLAKRLELDKSDIEQDFWVVFLRRFKPTKAPITFKTQVSRLVEQIARDLKKKYAAQRPLRHLDPLLLDGMEGKKETAWPKELSIEKLPEGLRRVCSLSLKHPASRAAYYLRISKRRYWALVNRIVRILKEDGSNSL